MKKAGTVKAGPSKTATKSVPKASSSVLLYHFKNGVIHTCEVPSFRFETHAQTFPSHRCGFINNKLYLLSIGNDWGYQSTSSFKGVLRVYDLSSHLVEQSMKARACSNYDTPLFIRGQQMLDLGSQSVLQLTTGQSEPIKTLGELEALEEYGACQVLHKLMYLIGGAFEPYSGQGVDDEEESEEINKLTVWTINWVGFKATRVGVWPDIKLKDASILPLSASEFLVTGTLLGESGTAAFRLRGNTLSREGGSSKVLGRCSSSCVQGSFLYMLYDSGLVKCDLGTGLMRVYVISAIQN